jgi:tartrate-resistant acid phosphatase type 5
VKWFAVLGNHDYVGSIDAQVDKTYEDDLWNMPKRDYVQIRALANGARLAMVFLDTNFLYHGYMQKGSDWYTMAMYYNDSLINRWPQMLLHGMTSETTGDDQLMWLEEQLYRYQSFEYIIVVGHHPLAICEPHRRTNEIDALLQKYPLVHLTQPRYSVSAYFAGHAHYLGRAVKNNVNYFLNGASGQNLLKRAKCDVDEQAERVETWFQHGFQRAVIDVRGLRVETWTREGLLDISPNIKPRSRLYESSAIV